MSFERKKKFCVQVSKRVRECRNCRGKIQEGELCFNYTSSLCKDCFIRQGISLLGIEAFDPKLAAKAMAQEL